MLKSLLKLLLAALLYVAAGASVMVGMLAAAHYLPAPEQRVVFCLVPVKGDIIENCAPLADWLDGRMLETRP